MNHRVDWHDLPTAARAEVEQHTGPVQETRTAPHGVMSRLACAIRTEAGAAFVKGVPHDDPQAWVYRHEAQITRYAPCAPEGVVGGRGRRMDAVRIRVCRGSSPGPVAQLR